MCIRDSCRAVFWTNWPCWKCKNGLPRSVLDQLTLLNMQKWLAAQCFGPIDLAENAKMACRAVFWTNRPCWKCKNGLPRSVLESTKQVFWNDQQVLKKSKKFWLLELLGFIFKSFLQSDHFGQLVWGGTLWRIVFDETNWPCWKCKNGLTRSVLDQLTLLKMQKLLDGQCFGPIDLAENAHFVGRSKWGQWVLCIRSHKKCMCTKYCVFWMFCLFSTHYLKATSRRALIQRKIRCKRISQVFYWNPLWTDFLGFYWNLL